MPLLIKHTSPLAGVWQITESTGQLLSMLEKQDKYLFEIDSMKSERRRLEWLATRVLIKELLNEEPEIAYHDNGAPYLPDNPLNISISHAKGYAAVILQPSPFSGIDIECKSDRILKVCDRFMRDEEKLSVDSTHEIDHLYIYWCAKEALFKMIGQKDIDFRVHLHVEPFPYSESGILNVQELKTPDKRKFELAFQVTPDFVWVWSK